MFTEEGQLNLWCRAMMAVMLCGALCPQHAHAQVAPAVWPRCIPERDGQQIGLAGSVCECRFEPGGTMIRKPPGWRWACDIMQMDGSSPRNAEKDTGPSSPLPTILYAPQTGASPKALFSGHK